VRLQPLGHASTYHYITKSVITDHDS